MNKDLDYSASNESNKKYDDDYDPQTAHNSYSHLTIGNAKNHEVLEKTKGVHSIVYTQDLKTKHEDRFLFGATTMSNLQSVRMFNPTHRFTAQITVPPGETIYNGMERMLENTLSQIADAFVIRIFGGSIDNPDDDDSLLPWNGDDKQCLDWAFVVANMALKVPITALLFGHYAAADYDPTVKDRRLSLFDQHGNLTPCADTIQFNQGLRYQYELSYLTRVVHKLFTHNQSLRYVELNVDHTPESDEFEDFQKFCAKANIEIHREPSKLTFLRCKR